MKQVWQADDGTIFEKEIDCERYEAEAETLKELENYALGRCSAEDFDSWLEVSMMLVEERKELFLRYINYLGER